LASSSCHKDITVQYLAIGVNIHYQLLIARKKVDTNDFTTNLKISDLLHRSTMKNTRAVTIPLGKALFAACGLLSTASSSTLSHEPHHQQCVHNLHGHCEVCDLSGT
jgi:hypothetical protein